MSETPLYDALSQFAGENPARFHIPGHKGTPIFPQPEDGYRLDFTELPPTGNLYEGGDAIAKAQDLWAKAWGMGPCQFLTGGSTQGIQTAFFLSCKPGETVLIDRACHRSVHNAMALLDLHPHYLLREIESPILPEDVENFLGNHPEVKTVCITSPTYYGLLSDVGEIARVVHRFGGTLVVDGAHGCHLPFLGENPFLGADLVVTSAHKTLPVLGQGALLFSGEKYAPRDLRAAASITGTSSPSYPILASMDLARGWMEGEGVGEYGRVISFADKLRKHYPCFSGPEYDPARLVVRCRDGFAAEKALQEEGVFPEMADCRHLVFVLTGRDSDESLRRLRRSLALLWEDGLLEEDSPHRRLTELPPVPPPEQAVSPRQALFSLRETVRVTAAQGRIAACQIAPYPPGVPVVAPGEIITKKHLAYLKQIGYNQLIAVMIS